MILDPCECIGRASCDDGRGAMHMAAGSGGDLVTLPADVDDLSASSDAAPAEPSQGSGKKRKRETSQAKRAPCDDADALRKMLARRCHKSCQRKCKQHFRQVDHFESLLSFRRAWRGFHKLDQDEIAALLHSESLTGMVGSMSFTGASIIY